MEPCPDYVYGMKETQFPDTSLKTDPMAAVYRSVTPGMHWAFFVVEYKSAADGIAEAENQAIRDGAVLVNARLRLKELRLQQKLKPEENYVRPIGADHDSFVFSCAWIPDMAKIFVNWFEKLADGQEIFHMSEMGLYVMTRPKEISAFRRNYHNILDWGLFEYGPAAAKVFTEISTTGRDIKAATSAIAQT